MKSWWMAAMAMAACWIADSTLAASTTRLCQKSGQKCPGSFDAVTVRKKENNCCSMESRLYWGTLFVGNNGGRCGELPEALTGVYPLHFRLLEVHLLQQGFSSPHLTFRVLLQSQSHPSTKQRRPWPAGDLLACNATCPRGCSTSSKAISRFMLHDRGRE